MAIQIGDRVGDYQVIGILGAGGMGQVFKVRNAISDRVEALKILLPDLEQDNELTERFLREIRVLAALEHPNIAQLRTAQREGNQLLMVMEYIDGHTLEALLLEGPMPLEWQIHVIAEVLNALQYAHQRGVVHRDLKPSNIMMTTGGEVKLMDFGIAKLTAEKGLTTTGAAPGSLYYMSPEQIQGAPTLDARSDIYSLGICLYQMVTGKRPFDATSQYSLMSAHLNLTPREPIECVAGVPAALNAIIMKALAKKPDDRFQSAWEMWQAIDAVRREVYPQASAPAPTTARSTPPSTPAPAVMMPRPPASRLSPSATSTVPATGVQPPPPMPPPPPRLAPMPVAAQGKSRRGLYMALGSVATVGVLGAALFLAPRFMHTAASNEPRPAQVVTQPPVQPPPPAVSEPRPMSKPEARPAARPAVASQPPVAPPRQEPVVPPQPPPQSPVQRRQEPLVPTQQQPVVEQQQPSEAAIAEQRRAMVAELRQEYNHLAIRQGTVTSGLQSLQNQMGGLGLRNDMREIAARMNYQLGEAMEAIRQGEPRIARLHLDNAERAIERLEKFLGH